MNETSNGWRRKAMLMAIYGSLSAAILVPFFAGYFPPLISSLLLALTGFFLAGVAIGTPLQRRLVFGIVVLLLSPFLMIVASSLGLWHGYATPPRTPMDDFYDNDRP